MPTYTQFQQYTIASSGYDTVPKATEVDPTYFSLSYSGSPDPDGQLSITFQEDAPLPADVERPLIQVGDWLYIQNASVGKILTQITSVGTYSKTDPKHEWDFTVKDYLGADRFVETARIIPATAVGLYQIQGFSSVAGTGGVQIAINPEFNNSVTYYCPVDNPTTEMPIVFQNNIGGQVLPMLIYNQTSSGCIVSNLSSLSI